VNQTILDLKLNSVVFLPRDNKVRYEFDISLKKHQIIGLYGTCGSGKSTICKIAAAIIPYEEKAIIDGQVMWTFSRMKLEMGQLKNPEEIYRRIGYVNQNPEKNYICEYVIDELVFNMEMRGYSEEYIFMKIDYILAKYDIKHLIQKKTNQLSGGEKQLICVLSSILHAPELLILDEPTAQLDNYWTDCVSEHLRSLIKSEDLAILISSHKYKFLASLGCDIVSLSGTQAVQKNEKLTSIIKKEKTIDKPIISVSGLEIRRSNQLILTDVSFKLFTGDSVLLLGKNGSGKSSLLEGIAGLLKTKYRNIKFFHGTKRIYPRRLQLVFQNPDHQIFTDSIENELKLGFSTGSYAEQEQVERLNLFSEHLQFLNNRRDLDPRQLSWGQKKIMNILISFCLIDFENNILLLDEPDLALDTNHLFNLTELYKLALESGLTIITVSHNLEIYQNLYNRIFIIENHHLRELDFIP
jgi:energy-coupling factor transport system ATP-binding protein